MKNLCPYPFLHLAYFSLVLGKVVFLAQTNDSNCTFSCVEFGIGQFEISWPITLYEFSVASLRNLLAVLYLPNKAQVCCSCNLMDPGPATLLQIACSIIGLSKWPVNSPEGILIHESKFTYYFLSQGVNVPWTIEVSGWASDFFLIIWTCWRFIGS